MSSKSWLMSCYSEAILKYLRSDNGPELIANKLRKWLTDIGAIATYIEPGSPWENGYIESLNSRMRDEFLNGEFFGSMHEAKIRRAITMELDLIHRLEVVLQLHRVMLFQQRQR